MMTNAKTIWRNGIVAATTAAAIPGILIMARTVRAAVGQNAMPGIVARLGQSADRPTLADSSRDSSRYAPRLEVPIAQNAPKRSVESKEEANGKRRTKPPVKPAMPEFRRWTRRDAKSAELAFVALEGEIVLFLGKSGRVRELPLEDLSESDQTLIRELVQKQKKVEK